MKVDGDIFIDMYKIGEDIGLVDGIQTDHIVEILLKDGYIDNHKETTKIRLTEEGPQKVGEIIKHSKWGNGVFSLPT